MPCMVHKTIVKQTHWMQIDKPPNPFLGIFVTIKAKLGINFVIYDSRLESFVRAIITKIKNIQ